MAKLHRDSPRPAPTPADRAQTQGMDQAARALSYLISGVLVWGGLGWLGDHLLHTSFLIGIGIVVGAALGVYLIIVHFGQEARAEAAGPDARRPPDRTSGQTPDQPVNQPSKSSR